MVPSPCEFCCELGKVSTQQKLLIELCLHFPFTYTTQDHVSILDKPMNNILYIHNYDIAITLTSSTQYAKKNYAL